ncbi:MAG: methionyl-tRNA formyltransferase [Planctomycetia bacterium]
MTATAIHDESTRHGLRPLRLVVMGTGPFAVPMFKALVGSSHTIAAVITRPDRAAPGRRPPTNPMREAASAVRLPILDPANVNGPESVAVIRGLAPDLLVVCDYGQILSAELLATAPLGGINLHGSLLPRHRGAAPVQWAILAGDQQTGVSVIHMTPTLDAGAVIAVRSTPIGPRETAPDLEARLAETGADAVLEAIERLQAARATGDHAAGAPQDESRATRAPRLTKGDGIVDWSRPAAAIERMRRALEPWPRTTTFLRGDGTTRRLVLEEVSVAAGRAPDGTAPGTVLAADDQGIVVACGEGTAVVIARLVPEGKRSMGVGEFLRGNPIHAGTQLG